jgi:PST family polysaccharide transporter
LGIFTNNTIVGYYAAADKIIQAVKGLMSPIFQSLYPFINKKVSESEILGLNLIRKITKFVAIITFTTSLLVLIFSDKIVTVVLGNGYQESIIILMILSFHPFLIGLSNIFGVQTMLSFNRKKIFQNILVTASILNIMLSLILVPHFKYIGSAISVTIVEIFVTLAMFIYLQKSGIKILELKNV